MSGTSEFQKVRHAYCDLSEAVLVMHGITLNKLYYENERDFVICCHGAAYPLSTLFRCYRNHVWVLLR